MIEILLLLIALGISCNTIFDLNWRANWKDKMFISLIAFSTAFCLLVLFSIPFKNDPGVEVSRSASYKGDIYSLRNQEDISGNFFLGTGYIGSQEYYYIFQKDDRGGMFRVTLPSYNCFIFQRNETPHLEWQWVTYRVPKWYSLWPQFRWQMRTKYDIIVPTNTVVERFQVN